MQVTSSVNNLIIGKLYVDHNGTMRIRNTQSNLTARLKFHEAGMFNSKDSHLVTPLPHATFPQCCSQERVLSWASPALSLNAPTCHPLWTRLLTDMIMILTLRLSVPHAAEVAGTGRSGPGQDKLWC